MFRPSALAVRETDFIQLPINWPEVALLHFARSFQAGLDGGFIHGFDPGGADGFKLGLVDGFQEARDLLHELGRPDPA